MNDNEPCLKIREATPGDVESIVLFNQQMALETEDLELDATRLRSGVEKAVARPDLCRYFLAEQDGRVIGQVMVTYEWSDWRDGCFWWLQSVYIDGGHRRQGVFRALYRHVERLARESRDGCGLRLYVHAANGQAMSTYGRLGMSDTQYVVYETDWPGSSPGRGQAEDVGSG